jgi:beta-adrenergic-receptor kinase
MTCLILLLVISVLQLIPMTEIQEIIPEFQKLNKTENCIVLLMKNDSKIAITSPVSFFF